MEIWTNGLACARELRRDEASTGSDLTKRDQLANLFFANLNAFFTKHAVNMEGGGWISNPWHALRGAAVVLGMRCR